MMCFETVNFSMKKWILMGRFLVTGKEGMKRIRWYILPFSLFQELRVIIPHRKRLQLLYWLNTISSFLTLCISNKIDSINYLDFIKINDYIIKFIKRNKKLRLTLISAWSVHLQQNHVWFLFSTNNWLQFHNVLYQAYFLITP